MRISDWSSDVCSSDLELFVAPTAVMKALAGFARATIGGTLEPRLGFAVGDARNGADGVRAQLAALGADEKVLRSEEHTSELQSLMRISYAVFCLKRKNTHLIYRSMH